MQAHEEMQEMDSIRAYNMQLLANILPMHVAQHFLKHNKKNEVLFEKTLT